MRRKCSRLVLCVWGGGSVSDRLVFPTNSGGTTLIILQTRVRLMLLASGIVAAVCLVGAQQPMAPSAQGDPLGQIVPVDPLITVGTLPNGLRYYIRANTQPRARAELRLVVNAGSVLEDDDQRGLAHFVEHMSFNGTLHFPQQ